jgi:choline dehydrogenase-like flavoprotein
MIYTRGQREDYDDWAALPGCKGWSYDDLLPYFKRPEHFEVESDNPYHGNDGELNVTNVAMKYPISEAYMQAAESIGNQLHAGHDEERPPLELGRRVSQPGGSQAAEPHHHLEGGGEAGALERPASSRR